MPTPIFLPKVSFKQKMHLARETAILQETCALLSGKAFDDMTMDAVAHAVGVAKACLYKHFDSKEELCCAAIVKVMRQMQDLLQGLPSDTQPQDKLKAVLHWVLMQRMAQKIPLLPSKNSLLYDALIACPDYMNGLAGISQTLSHWIVQAQEQGQIDPLLPPKVVLYTLHARAFDPIVNFLQEARLGSETEVVDWVLHTCFNGLAQR